MGDGFFALLTAAAAWRAHVLASWIGVVAMGSLLSFAIVWSCGKAPAKRQLPKITPLVIVCPFVAMIAVRQDAAAGVLGISWMFSTFMGGVTGVTVRWQSRQRGGS